MALGSPCLQHVTPLAIRLEFAPSPTFSDALSIPSSAWLLGVEIYTQSAVLDSAITAGGIATSNGVETTIGNV